jgi:CheY-like chemotaxis protein
MLNETGCCNSARNPAMRGSIAVLYATGEGQTNPPGVTGSVAAFERVSDYPPPRLPVKVTVGGVPAQIIFAAEAPHAVAGFLQVNFRVPRAAPVGDAVPLSLTIGGVQSAAGVTMAIRSPVRQILIAEPEAARRHWLQYVLARAGYGVWTARDGAEAVEQARRHIIDLAIASLALPDSQRLEEIRELRPQLRVIAIAPALTPESLRAADLFGAQAVLARPLRAEAVLRKARESLKVRPVPYVAVTRAP